MDNFSYTDNIRAAFATCLPCFGVSRSKCTANPSVTATHSEPRSSGPSSSSDLEHLLRDAESDVLSLHSNIGTPAHRRAKHRRRPRFSLTLFGYTLFGRPPIYLSDDDEDDWTGGRTRALAAVSSSTFDSDAAPLDAGTIERLTSPDHYAALAAQRERERQQLEAEEAARRKAERRARRQERKARARAEALLSLTGSSRSDMDTFEGSQGSGDGTLSPLFSPHQTLPSNPSYWNRGRLTGDGDVDGSPPGDVDAADLDGELYTRKKKSSAAIGASASDSRSRTSASLSSGDASHTQNFSIHATHQFVPYAQTEMRLPVPARQKSHRASKRASAVSSVTSQSTSATPYTPIESIAAVPAVAAFPVPHERYLRDGDRADFPSMGLSGKRGPNSLDAKSFLARQG